MKLKYQTAANSIILLLLSWLVANANGADDFVFKLAVSEQDSAAKALDLLKEKAINKAIENLLPFPTDEAAKVRERTLKQRAVAQRDILLKLELIDGPRDVPLHGWRVEANVTVFRGPLEALRADVEGRPAAQADRDAVRGDRAPDPASGGTVDGRRELKVIVLATQKIEWQNLGPNNPPLVKIDDAPHVAQPVKKKLIEFGFKSLNAGQIEKLRKKDVGFAGMAGEDKQKLFEIANREGCDIVITIDASISGPRHGGSPDIPVYVWETIPVVTAFLVDTGEEISVPFDLRAECKEGASRVAGPQGAREAAINSATCFAEQLVRDIDQRVRQINGKPRAIKVTITGADARQTSAMSEQIKSVKGVNSVVIVATDRAGAELEVVTAMAALDLQLAILDLKFEKFRLDGLTTGLSTVELQLRN